MNDIFVFLRKVCIFVSMKGLKKIVVVLGVLLVGAMSAFGATGGECERLLAELDKTIAEREHYIDKKYERIWELKKQLFDNGEDFCRFDIPDAAIGTTMHLIFNNGVGGEGGQFDGPVVEFTGNLYYRITATSFEEVQIS